MERKIDMTSNDMGYALIFTTASIVIGILVVVISSMDEPSSASEQIASSPGLSRAEPAVSRYSPDYTFNFSGFESATLPEPELTERVPALPIWYPPQQPAWPENQ